MQNVMSAGVIVFSMASPKLAELRIDVGHRRFDFLFGRLDSQELDQPADIVPRRLGQCGEVDSMDWDLWMTGDESFAMIQKRMLQSFTFALARGEPLTAVFVTAILEGANRRFDWPVDRNDAQ